MSDTHQVHGRDKGRPKNAPGFKRHQHQPRDIVKGISRGSIRRMALRAGVKRISRGCEVRMRQQLIRYVNTLTRDSLVYASYAKRKTVYLRDALAALLYHNQNVLGFMTQEY